MTHVHIQTTEVMGMKMEDDEAQGLTQQREGLSGLLQVLSVVHSLDEDVLALRRVGEVLRAG